jgi:PAS domain S-box-containing protein
LPTLVEWKIMIDSNRKLSRNLKLIIAGFTAGSAVHAFAADSDTAIFDYLATDTTIGLTLAFVTGLLIGLLVRFVQMRNEISHRLQTEGSLRESEQMLQLIMDTIPMAVYWKDTDSVYLGSNKTFIKECGLSTSDDVVGKTPFDIFGKDQAPSVIARDQQVITTNRSMYDYVLKYTTDGSIGWREASKMPLRDSDGQAVGIMGVWRDVTEQNQGAERLKQTLDDMERFNQLMRGRERRTLELKTEINSLLEELGRQIKYKTSKDGPS